MGRVIILGSSSAVPVIGHENTHLLVEACHRTVLIDCPGNPFVRLEQAGADPQSLTDIILTHFHPDHVSGFGSLLMSLWLTGRTEPLSVYGLEHAIDRAQKMMDLFSWKHWPEFYPVHFKTVPAEEFAPVVNDENLRIFASPVNHLIPTIGLRFEFGQGSQVMTYSCDTEPSQTVLRLAQGANILIHESTGASVGHTSAEMAGNIATQAGVGALYLIHYPPKLVDPDDLLARASATFQGPISVAQDLMTIEISENECV